MCLGERGCEIWRPLNWEETKASWEASRSLEEGKLKDLILGEHKLSLLDGTTQQEAEAAAIAISLLPPNRKGKKLKKGRREEGRVIWIAAI